MPALSAVLQVERRSARILFCAPAGGGSDGVDHLRPKQWVLCRSNREETAESFFAGNERAFIWHGWMQSRLPVLSELGHLQSSRMGQARGRGITGTYRARSGATRLPIGRVHLQ